MSVQRCHVAHVSRVAEHDPLARVGPLGPAGPGASAPEVLVSDDGDTVVLLDTMASDPTTTAGLWVAPRVARLQLRAATEPAAAAALPLLRRAVDAAPTDLEVHLTVASRDLALVRPLLEAGFAPATVLAVRRPAATVPAPGRAAAAGVTVRPADPGSASDAAALTGHRVALQRFETGTSLVPVRRDAEPLLRAAVVEQLREHPGWSWLAERDGVVIGSCEVEPPGAAGWVAAAVTEDADAVAYLEELHVTGAGRGLGVGTALVTAAHEALAAAGARAVLLHHGATNPLSTPFWARAGYRPLHTAWVRAPRATHLRATHLRASR